MDHLTARSPAYLWILRFTASKFRVLHCDAILSANHGLTPLGFCSVLHFLDQRTPWRGQVQTSLSQFMLI